jgi:hypothetical protein
MPKLLQWEDSNFYMTGIHVLLEMHRKQSIKSKTKLGKKNALTKAAVEFWELFMHKQHKIKNSRHYFLTPIQSLSCSNKNKI